MTTDDHRRLRELLGPFALGHLGEPESTQVRSHLVGCDSCSEELASLLPVVRQLELVDAAYADGPWQLPAGLEDRVVGGIDAERSAARRRWYVRTSALAGAAALAAAVVSALVVIGLRPPGPTLEPVAVQVETAGVTADADLVAHTWGTEIKLNATGLHAGETYRVSIVTGDGEERPAGEFVGTGSRPLHCNLNSGVLRPEATGFVVLDRTGHEVLASTFT